MGERQLPPVPTAHGPDEEGCERSDGEHRDEEVDGIGPFELQPGQGWMNSAVADDDAGTVVMLTRCGAVQAVIGQSPGGMES